MGCQVTFKKVFFSGEQVHKARVLGWKGENTEELGMPGVCSSDAVAQARQIK